VAIHHYLSLTQLPLSWERRSEQEKERKNEEEEEEEKRRENPNERTGGRR
jgi:hypothetical protein